MQVLKFGGTSVANAQNINKVAAVVEQYIGKQKTIVVVSALSGITDKLIETGKRASQGDESYKELLKEIEERHLQLVRELIPVAQHSSILSTVKKKINELESVCEGVFLLKELSARSLDHITSFGEQLSSLIISKRFESGGMKQLWVDSRELICTDENYNAAAVDFALTNKLITDFFQQQDSSLYLLPGFIASDKNKHTTTLGRGGSDYTAAILAGALNASVLEIWTDVSGMMTADPRVVANARIIPKVSYKEAMELSHFGAKVIYPPTIHPAMNKNIPIVIKNTFAPQDKGTSIETNPDSSDREVCGISGIGKIALLTLEGTGMVGIPGFSARLFNALAKEKINVILITQGSSEHSICVAVNEEVAIKAKLAVNEEFKHEIQNGRVLPLQSETDLCIVAVVGGNMKNHPGISGKMFGVMGRNGINVRAIAQGSSEMNISSVIALQDMKKAINVLHEEFFEESTRQLNLFVVGCGNVGGRLIDLLHQQAGFLSEQLHLQIKIVAIANSKKVLLNENGIDLNNWKQELDKGQAMPLEQLIDTIHASNLRNAVFVDVTANGQVANCYDKLLQKSISVVACNKIACSASLEYYARLKKLAREYNASFLYETNVGAGLPVIKTLNDLVMSGDKVIRMEAVLSGSLNFIFNNYDGTNSFASVVKQAGVEGYTEPDPRIDLSGTDVARKILILAREAGLHIEMKDIDNNSFLPASCMQGDVPQFFEELVKHEAHFKKLYTEAHEKGCKLKFVASLDNGKAAVGLKQVDKDHDLYRLQGKDNVVVFYTERYSQQPLVVKGAGAGADVTASGIFADILRTVKS